MTRDEIDIMWQQAMQESIKDGEMFTRYRFAKFVEDKALAEHAMREVQRLGQEIEQEPVMILPDGSAFGVMSFPLPDDHWLYAPNEYKDGEYEPIDLPKPILTHELRDAVVAAVRYSVRGATMRGQETDFDPDALVQNAVYALCGPYATPPQRTEQEPVAMRMPKVGDEVVCIDDDSLGEVAYLTAGGSPEIKFDDGSHGTYLLREFAELFRYATPQPAPVLEQPAQQEPVAWIERDIQCDDLDPDSVTFEKPRIAASSSREWVSLYTTPPQRTWVELTEQEHTDIAVEFGCMSADWVFYGAAVERKVKERNT